MVRECAMRISFLIAVATFALALPATAQQAEPPKPELIIGGQAPPAATRERCVEVEIGGAKSFGCLNQKLKRDAGRVNPLPNIPPLDAKSSDTKIGIVNLPGVQQQYGRNCVSVVPFRLPSPVFIGRR
jgi:hypothetical protein